MRSVLELIGNTPMIEVARLDTGRCRLFLKLENQNPGGSIKDRIALSMIESAEREKKIQKGSLIVEATAGNTGLGLALVASQKGYRLLIVVPDKMSQEKIFHLKALGAEIWEQMEHQLDALVCGVGTGGTLTGLGRFFAKVAPTAEMVLADPQGSILAPL